MKKIIVIVFAILLGWAGSAGAILLSFAQSSLAVLEGDSFAVDLMVSELDNAQVGEFDIDILYNPLQMSFTGSALDNFLGDSTAGEAIDLSFGDPGGVGAIDVAELSLLFTDELAARQAMSFRLATLNFTCLALGTSMIGIDTADSWLVAGDGAGDALPLEFGSPVEVRQTSGTAPVPEPATMLLFATGLAGFAGTMLKRQKR